jgi:hypothetical protein
MCRLLISLQHIPHKAGVGFKSLDVKRKRWLHQLHHSIPKNDTFTDYPQQQNLAIDVPIAYLKKLRGPAQFKLPDYLRDTWIAVDSVPLSNTKDGTQLYYLMRPALVPVLRREHCHHLSLSTESYSIQVSGREIKQLQCEKAIRTQLRERLARCKTTKDIFRVAAAAFHSKRVAKQFARVGNPVTEAFYRARCSASDLSIAHKIAVLIKRIEQEGLPAQDILFTTGLMYAIRSRNLSITKRYLLEFRTRDITIYRNVFRRLIGKCSIGIYGLGEIRNGRWIRDELIQVLLGFPDARPGHEYHLGSFLDRNSWFQMVHWLQILGRCGLNNQLWKEWELWKHSTANMENRPIVRPLTDVTTKMPIVTASVRAARMFVQQFIITGDFQSAWRIIAETGLDPMCLDRDRLHQLLQWANMATVWNEQMRQALMEMYQDDLAAMEHFLGVEWVPDGRGDGYHRPMERMRDALEELSEENFFQTFGYIHDRKGGVGRRF